MLLLSLNTMLHLELPHINVLSKVDLLVQYGKLGAWQEKGKEEEGLHKLHGKQRDVSPLTANPFPSSSSLLSAFFRLQPRLLHRGAGSLLHGGQDGRGALLQKVQVWPCLEVIVAINAPSCSSPSSSLSTLTLCAGS
jgi:hypothetical protein